MVMLSSRDKLLREIRLLMGGGMVNVELTPDHFSLAFDIAIERYRLRANNAQTERYAIVQFQPEQQSYLLPEEVTGVRKIFRRGYGFGGVTTGSNLDPFSLGAARQFIGLNSPTGGILTYDLFAGFREIVGKMFGAQVPFFFNPTTHELMVERKFNVVEDIILWIYCQRSEDELLSDSNARIWLRDYTTARAKFMLGEIRGKFQSIAGPQGGTSLNGDALKTEAQADMDRLEDELRRLVGSDMGYGFIIG